MPQIPPAPQTRLRHPPDEADPGDSDTDDAARARFELLLSNLSDGHERCEEMLEALQGLASRLQELGPDERARSVATEVIDFFDTQAPHHRAEEERDVLPVLRRRGGAAGTALAARLESEHGLLAHAWNRCRPALAELGATGRWPKEAAALEFERWRDLATLATAHMLAENGAAFPSLRALMAEWPPPS